MRVKIQCFLMLLLQLILCNGQVGMGTTSPEGVLHILNNTREMGLVLPRAATAESVAAVNQSTPLEGTMIYDNAQQCVRIRKSTAWSDCLATEEDIPAGRRGRRMAAARNNAMIFINSAQRDAVYGMGSNDTSQLVSTQANNTLRSVNSNRSFRDVAMGTGNGASVASDGGYWAWGDNTYGKLGNGNTGGTLTSVQNIALPGNVLAQRVRQGYFNTLVLGQNGQLYVAGFAQYGITARGTANLYTGDVVNLTAIAFFADKEVVTMDVGMQQAIALTSDGKVYVWGANGNTALKRLGLPTGDIYAVPTLLNLSGVLNAGESVVEVAVDDVTYGGGFITSQGRYFAFGYIYNVGGSNSYVVPTEIRATGLQAGEYFTGFDLDYNAVALITNRNRLFVAGINTEGRLSTGNTNAVRSLTPANTSNVRGTIVDVAIGINNMYVEARDSNGVTRIYGAGRANESQLNNNTQQSMVLVDVLR